jgi:hypothetical protein
MEIQGYSNYLIYEDGRVYSKIRKRFLKEQNDKGYNYCALYKDGKPKNKKIHRLVALHYIPNPENKPEVDHINRDKKDNRVENLRWATKCENQQNQGINKNNTTGIPNIHYCKMYCKWIYKKKINKNTHTARFKTIEEAIEYKEQFEKSLQIQ